MGNNKLMDARDLIFKILQDRSLDMRLRMAEVLALAHDLQRRVRDNVLYQTDALSATFHFNTSVFRKLLYRYKETGEVIYFDIQVTNEDPSATIGRQTVILKDCCMDGGILAKFDADGAYLDEEMDFTFEDWEMPEEFKMLAGMQ